MSYHCYAYDPQLYLAVRSCDDRINMLTNSKAGSLAACWNWTLQKPNSSFFRQRVLWICLKITLRKSCHPLHVLTCIKSLGVMLDQNRSMRDQVEMTVKKDTAQVEMTVKKGYGRIRRYMPKTTCKTLVYALVTSCLVQGCSEAETRGNGFPTVFGDGSRVKKQVWRPYIWT